MPHNLAFWTCVSPCAVSLPDSLLIFISPLTVPSVPFRTGELRNFGRSLIPTCFRARVPRNGAATGLLLPKGTPLPWGSSFLRSFPCHMRRSVDVEWLIAREILYGDIYVVVE